MFGLLKMILESEADDCREEAKRIVRRAESVHEKYKKLEKTTKNMASELNQQMQKHNDYKVELLQELSSDISTAIKDFKDFDISSRTINQLKNSSSLSLNDASVFHGAGLTTSFSGMGDIGFISFLGGLNSLDEAQEQKRDAEKYLSSVNKALSELQNAKLKIESLMKHIKDEHEMLVELMEKLRSIISQLKSAMQKASFAEEEAQKMQGICKIAELIKKTLETRMVDTQGNIEHHYQEYYESIKKINQAIPNRPIIEESKNWMDLLLGL